MRKLAEVFTITDLLKSYPILIKEQILAAREYASDIITNEEWLETA